MKSHRIGRSLKHWCATLRSASHVLMNNNIFDAALRLLSKNVVGKAFQYFKIISLIFQRSGLARFS